MTRKFSKTLTALVFGAITLTLTACGQDNTASTTPADNSAATTPTTATVDDVAARQAIMKDWRGASDIIKGMLEDPNQFNAAVLQEQTKFLVESSAQAWTHFGDANQKGKSQDAVWGDAAGFKAATEAFNAAVVALDTAAQTAQSSADIQEAFGKVGESCGSCHKVFKQK